jgi:hypothetical protein
MARSQVDVAHNVIDQEKRDMTNSKSSSGTEGKQKVSYGSLELGLSKARRNELKMKNDFSKRFGLRVNKEGWKQGLFFFISLLLISFEGPCG